MNAAIRKPGRPKSSAPMVRAIKLSLKADADARFTRVCAAYDQAHPTMGDQPSIMARLAFMKGLEALEAELGLQPELPLEPTTKKPKS